MKTRKGKLGVAEIIEAELRRAVGPSLRGDEASIRVVNVLVEIIESEPDIARLVHLIQLERRVENEGEAEDDELDALVALGQRDPSGRRWCETWGPIDVEITKLFNMLRPAIGLDHPAMDQLLVVGELVRKTLRAPLELNAIRGQVGKVARGGGAPPGLLSAIIETNGIETRWDLLELCEGEHVFPSSVDKLEAVGPTRVVRGRKVPAGLRALASGSEVESWTWSTIEKRLPSKKSPT